MAKVLDFPCEISINTPEIRTTTVQILWNQYAEGICIDHVFVGKGLLC